MTERIVRRTPLKRTRFKQRAPRKEGIPKKLREQVLRRDGGCVLRESVYGPCWGAANLHHILPRSRGGEHSDDNLIVLCNHHHINEVHAHPAWARDMGYLR